jgi:hypothetical protein
MLFGALALGLAASASPVQAAPGPLPPPEDMDLARALFKEMIEIKTTHDVGSTALARAIEDHLLHAGFAASGADSAGVQSGSRAGAAGEGRGVVWPGLPRDSNLADDAAKRGAALPRRRAD